MAVSSLRRKEVEYFTAKPSNTIPPFEQMSCGSVNSKLERRHYVVLADKFPESSRITTLLPYFTRPT